MYLLAAFKDLSEHATQVTVFLALRRLAVSAFIAVTVFQIAILPSIAEQSSTEERTDAAIGHYAKSRALLVEALEEFETARKLARPDLLIDPEEWRISVISRAEELNRILDPQPRITRSGTRFQANNRLVRRISKRDVNPLPLDSNSYGERSPSAAPKAPARKPASSAPKLETSSNRAKIQTPELTAKIAPTKEDITSSKTLVAAEKQTKEAVDIKPSNEPEANTSLKTHEAGVIADIKKEDPSVADMVEKVIESRVKKLKEEQAKDASKPKASNKTVDGLFNQYSDQ